MMCASSEIHLTTPQNSDSEPRLWMFAIRLVNLLSGFRIISFVVQHFSRLSLLVHKFSGAKLFIFDLLILSTHYTLHSTLYTSHSSEEVALVASLTLAVQLTRL